MAQVRRAREQREERARAEQQPSAPVEAASREAEANKEAASATQAGAVVASPELRPPPPRPQDRQWVDVSEAEPGIAAPQGGRELKEERRLKQMQEKIALLKARMGLREQHTVAHSTGTPSAAAHPSASHPRQPLTFTASPYASLSAARRPPSSPSRPRSSTRLFASPRRRPHPFLRHSPFRRRRLSLSPTKLLMRVDERRQQQHLPGSEDQSNAHQSAGGQRRQPTLRQWSPNRARTTDSPTRLSRRPAAPLDSGQHSRRASDVVSAANLSTILHSLVEAEIAKHTTELAHASTSRPAPPSPPFIPQLSQSTADHVPLLQRYASVSVLEHLDELVSDVLDRVVADTVAELNAAEERLRASAVLDEVDDMVGRLQQLEDSVAQRWLDGTPLPPRRWTEGAQQPYARADELPLTSSDTQAAPHRTTTTDADTSDLSSVSHSPAIAPSLSTGSEANNPSATAPRGAHFRPRVLPLCLDVSPQRIDPTGVAMAERWCDDWVDSAVSEVVDELWQTLDTLVDGLVEHEVS